MLSVAVVVVQSREIGRARCLSIGCNASWSPRVVARVERLAGPGGRIQDSIRASDGSCRGRGI